METIYRQPNGTIQFGGSPQTAGGASSPLYAPMPSAPTPGAPPPGFFPFVPPRMPVAPMPPSIGDIQAQMPAFQQQMTGLGNQMQQNRQQPAQPAQGNVAPLSSAPGPTAAGPTNNTINQIMDPAPYNRAVDQGNQFIRNTIPLNARPLLNSSPAFGNLSPSMTQGLNQQWGNRGQALQDRSGVEFARKAGTEVPQFMLSQLLGLRGLQNDWADLGNDFYRNDVANRTGGLDTMLRLLGALGGFF